MVSVSALRSPLNTLCGTLERPVLAVPTLERGNDVVYSVFCLLSSMDLSLFLQYLFAGVSYGIIYAIVAIGFNIIYNTTGIINFAQGEFVMLGGMIAISLHAFLPLPLAIAGAVLITMLVGALVEMVFIRWIDQPSVLRMIIITIGVSILIREAALFIWGEGVRALPYFVGTAVTSVAILGTRVSPQVLFVVGVCSIMVLCLNSFFKFTSLGREMRACAANRRAARPPAAN